MGAAAIGLSGCFGGTHAVHVNSAEASTIDTETHGTLKAVASLDCPTSEGALTRTSQAADGQTCDYSGPGGESVRLRRVALGGRTPTEALADTKAELWNLVPITKQPIPAVMDESGEHADVDLPFFHVHTVGDDADVKMFGVHIRAKGQNAEVHTNLGLKHTVVRAGRDGAEVVAEDVGKTNASLVYVLASERQMPSGYRVAGYVAKGPAKGPLVVGEFRSTEKHERNYGRDDVGRLIDLNVED